MHAPCSTPGRTSRHNTRNPPSDAHRFLGGTWRSEPDMNAHIRRRCNPSLCRLCSPGLGSSYIAPVTDMSLAGAFEKRSLSMPATITSRMLSCQRQNPQPPTAVCSLFRRPEPPARRHSFYVAGQSQLRQVTALAKSPRQPPVGPDLLLTILRLGLKRLAEVLPALAPPAALPVSGLPACA